MIGALLIGKFLDSSPLSLRRRALVSFLSIAAAIAGSWAWGLAANTGYRLDETPTEIDFQDGRWPAAALLYLLWGFCDAFIQCWVYCGATATRTPAIVRLVLGRAVVSCRGWLEQGAAWEEIVAAMTHGCDCCRAWQSAAWPAQRDAPPDPTSPHTTPLHSIASRPIPPHPTVLHPAASPSHPAPFRRAARPA